MINDGKQVLFTLKTVCTYLVSLFLGPVNNETMSTTNLYEIKYYRYY